MKHRLQFAAKKLLRMALLLLGVSIVTFALMAASPLDPLQTNVGQVALGSMSEEQVAQLEAYWGVDTPPVERYLGWLGSVLHGDFGVSLLYRRPVLDIIAERLQSSLWLLLAAWVISGVLGTALTPEQIKRLSGFTSRLVLLFDGDRAGRKAALRSCEMLLTRGLACTVVLMPDGEDIDSLLRAQGPEAFEALQAQAPDGLRFCLDVLRALDSIAAIPRALPLLCTADRAYYEETGGGEFLPLVQASYVSNARRPLREIARKEGVCKIAVYDELGPENNAMRALPQALPGLRVIQSGGNWLDISVPDANKGDAMRFLRERFALSREECAAFGDHMNDYEMLLECGHPYVTGNAYPPLKRRIGNAVRSNAENGVVRALQHIADGLLPNGRSMNENTSA